MGGRHGHPRFHALIEEMQRIHDAKNQDYAGPSDSLANFRECERMGLPAWKGCMVRLQDKYMRMVNLIEREARSGEGPTVKSETLLDTCLDLANYAVLLAVLREEWEAKWKA